MDGIERVMNLVDRRTPTECWPWRTSISGRYPAISVKCSDGRWRSRSAPKIVLEHKLGRPLQRGELTRHTCDNTVCCNPGHLIPGTSADNSRDMIERNRTQRRDANPNGRLTQAQVDSIVGDRRTLQAIANEFGVTKQRVWQLQREAGIR